MLFNSLEFAIFFPIVATMYFILPQRLRTPHLLVSSCIFYMAFIPAYIAILALTIAIDYTAGIYLEKVAGLFFVFKYFYFFTSNAIGL
jgi:alginate O-acetyltransferase complex protein AlgI